MLRALVFALWSLLLAGLVFFRYDPRFGHDGLPSLGRRPTYLPYYAAYLLPLCIPILLATLALMGFTRAAEEALSTYVGLFLHISLYHLALLLVLPLLRGRICARTCALLWVIPNLLYFTSSTIYRPAKPLWVLVIPGRWHMVALWVWLAGFLGVLGWHIAGHLRFRRRILAPALPVTDPQTLEVWQETLAEADLRRPKYRLVVSPAVNTPLSVGLIPRSTRVVLPPRPYTMEELHWVLRHEVIHLARQDSWNKFFLLFCTAVCWFNPVMWLAMKTCAQDLELSCDETVLLFAHGPQRKEYAALLLHTAGDARGFTTCLSASAASLRRRLRQVLSSAIPSSGAVAVGVIFFVLSVTWGWGTLAYSPTSGAQVLYAAQPASAVAVDGVHLYRPHTDPSQSAYTLTDPQALHQYFSGLTLAHLMGSYTFPDGQRDFYCFFTDGQQQRLIAITDQVMEVTVLGAGGSTHCYYITQGVDWDYLSGLMTQSP